MMHDCKNDDFVNDIWDSSDQSPEIFEWSGVDRFFLEYVEKYQIWKLTCNEYGVPIKYCPWCGEKLPIENSQS